MTKAVHFINRRVRPGREGLSRIGGSIDRSCCWAIDETHAAALVGGWIYLHEAKRDRAAFGGLARSVERVVRENMPHEVGHAIIFDTRQEANASGGAGHIMQCRGGADSSSWTLGMKGR